MEDVGEIATDSHPRLNVRPHARKVEIKKIEDPRKTIKFFKILKLENLEFYMFESFF